MYLLDLVLTLLSFQIILLEVAIRIVWERKGNDALEIA
jgi:hypothetical protein